MNKEPNNREDLANFISMITRDETPFMSSIGKTKATAILHEWNTEEYLNDTSIINHGPKRRSLRREVDRRNKHHRR